MSNNDIHELFEDLSAVGESTTGDNAQTQQDVCDEALSAGAYQDGTQYNIRDKLYSDLLRHYLDTHKSKTKCNKWYKCIFFFATMLAFIVMIAIPMYTMYLVAKRGNVQTEEVVLITSGIAGIISAIIVLPRIIAEHLFPKDEDQHMIGMVKNMQQNDSQIRNFIRNRRPISTDQDNANDNQSTYKIKDKQKQKPKPKQK